MNRDNTILAGSEAVNQYVDSTYQKFGPTKKQEISRLLFEILKREKSSLSEFVGQLPETGNNFNKLKTYLIKRRFPIASKTIEKNRFALGNLSINEQYRVHLEKKELYPANIYIEKAVSGSELANRFKR